GHALGALRLAAHLAGARRATGRLRRRRAGLAADRGAGRRQADVRLLELAARHQLQEGGPPVEEPLAGPPRAPTAEGGVGPGPLRGSLLARLPPPRLPDVPGLRLPRPGATARGRGAQQARNKKVGTRA